MVTTHYDIEDTPNMQDPEVVVELYQEARGLLKAKPAFVNENLAALEEILGAEFSKAQHAGDEGLMLSINTTWGHLQGFAQTIGHQEAALNGADAAIETLQAQRKKVVSELEELAKAITEGNEAHPKLMDFATAIRTEAWEEAGEEAEQEGLASAWDQINEQLAFIYCELSGEPVPRGWAERSDLLAQMDRLTDLFIGNEEPTEYQKELLLALFRTVDDRLVANEDEE